MTLVYGSVCDGISAASVAWQPLGFRCAWRSEIAAFPSRVLAHHWPDVPNFGDFTAIAKDGHVAPPVDVLVGGTPCQSFSVSGKRAGLDDPRGHLAVEFLLLARRLGARWLVWENVPGVFSVDDGDAFATFIGLATECGYGVSWRVLDAQYFGVPQRRRRVFVVGYLGDWRPPVAVLLESPSLRRNPPKGRGARSEVATGARGGAGEMVAGTLASGGRSGGSDHTPLIVSPTLTSHHYRNNGHDEPYAFEPRARLEVIGFHVTQDPISSEELSPAISANAYVGALVDAHPRRLTPREWERLQGFPDDHTLIEGADDSPRYEALGNSMAVPVMRWIGRRLQIVDGLARRAA